MKKPEPSADAVEVDHARRVESTGFPLMLATLIAPVEEGWFVDLGTTKGVVEVDPSVDPALLEQAHESGVRVVVDTASEIPAVVGLLTTHRTLELDRDGNVEANVGAFRIRAADEVLLRASGAYLRAKKAKVEIVGSKVVTRARDLAKILSAMIKLN